MTTPTGAAELPEALTDYLEAQDALDNREYMGLNAEPYEKLMRRRNQARVALDAALSQVEALSAAQAGVPADLITIRKPKTRAEVEWLMKAAHLLIGDVNKTLDDLLTATPNPSVDGGGNG